MSAPDPLSARCSYCYVGPGFPCRYRRRRALHWTYYSAVPYYYHAARVRRAEEKEEKRDPRT